MTVDGFASFGSAKESVFVGQDPTTTTAHWPDRISISDGTIYGSGYGTNALNTATAQALYINVGTAPGAGVISHIAVSNIVATHISWWGLQMAELQNDDLQLSNLQFLRCRQRECDRVPADSRATLSAWTIFSARTSGPMALRYQHCAPHGHGLNFTGVSQVSGTQSIYLSSTATGMVNHHEHIRE